MPNTLFPAAAGGMSKIHRGNVMRQAWADYRRDEFRGWSVRRGGPFDRKHFAYCLRQAWAAAKANFSAGSLLPFRNFAETPNTITDPALIARAATIRADLEWMQFGERIDWAAHSNLTAELATITAQAR